MKNFFVFAGNNYYPLGGGDDFLASFETHGEAEAAISVLVSEDWAHVWYAGIEGVVSEWAHVKPGSNLGEPGWITSAVYRGRFRR